MAMHFLRGDMLTMMPMYFALTASHARKRRGLSMAGNRPPTGWRRSTKLPMSSTEHGMVTAAITAIPPPTFGQMRHSPLSLSRYKSSPRQRRHLRMEGSDCRVAIDNDDSVGCRERGCGCVHRAGSKHRDGAPINKEVPRRWQGIRGLL
jgi:hypothetical protein